MGLFSRKVGRVGADVVERVRRAYRGLGPGLGPTASALFDQGDGGNGLWLRLAPRSQRLLRAADLSSTDLFVLPPAWEVTEVVPRRVVTGRDRVTVSGFMRCRPRGGSWEKVQVPFLHSWTFCGDRIQGFQSVLDEVELRRRDDASGCDAA